MTDKEQATTLAKSLGMTLKSRTLPPHYILIAHDGTLLGCYTELEPILRYLKGYAAGCNLGNKERE